MNTRKILTGISAVCMIVTVKIGECWEAFYGMCCSDDLWMDSSTPEEMVAELDELLDNYEPDEDDE